MCPIVRHDTSLANSSPEVMGNRSFAYFENRCMMHALQRYLFFFSQKGEHRMSKFLRGISYRLNTFIKARLASAISPPPMSKPPSKISRWDCGSPVVFALILQPGPDMPPDVTPDSAKNRMCSSAHEGSDNLCTVSKS